MFNNIEPEHRVLVANYGSYLDKPKHCLYRLSYVTDYDSRSKYIGLPDKETYFHMHRLEVVNETRCTYEVYDLSGRRRRVYKNSRSAYAKDSIKEAVISLRHRLMHRKAVLSAMMQQVDDAIAAYDSYTADRLIEEISNSDQGEK